MEHNRELKPDRMMNGILTGVKSFRTKLDNKLGMTITGLLFLSLLILIIVAGLKQRSASVSAAYKALSLAENNKKQHLDDELDRLQNQLRLFATDSRTSGAFSSLLQAFRNLESDNFYLPDASSMEVIRQKLENYFIAQLIPSIEEKTTEGQDLKTYLSDDPKQTILQFLYLASNSKPLGLKQEVMGAGDGSLYSGVHVQYQPWLLTYARQNKISDIYFIDSQGGYVFYSVKKYPDFGTSLFTGRYKNSFLSDAFRRAISDPSHTVVIFTDMDRRVPGLIPPCFYLATPMMQGNQVIGAIVFSIETGELDRLLASDASAGSKKETGVSSFILGSDRRYRSNDPDFLAAKSQYIKRLKHSRIPAEEALNIEKSAFTAMNLQAEENVFPEAGLGLSGEGRYVTPSGRRAFCSYTPVLRPGLNWILVTQVLQAEVLRPVRLLVFILAVAALFILLVGILISFRMSRKLALRVDTINGSLSTMIFKTDDKGDQNPPGDEIDRASAAIHKLKERIGEAASFASQLSEGKLDNEFKVENVNDLIGASLN
jgi:methyl-accepting chemotaxis protein